MTLVHVDYDHDQLRLVLRGPISALLKDPVIASFVREHHGERVADDKLVLPTLEPEVGSRFLTLTKFMDYGGFEVSAEGALSGTIQSIDEKNQRFHEFTEKAAAIWRNEFDADEFAAF